MLKCCTRLGKHDLKKKRKKKRKKHNVVLDSGFLIAEGITSPYSNKLLIA